MFNKAQSEIDCTSQVGFGLLKIDYSWFYTDLTAFLELYKYKYKCIEICTVCQCIVKVIPFVLCL